MLDESSNTKNHSNISLIFLTAIPLLNSIFNINTIDMKDKTYFNTYLTVASIIPHFIPFLFRNYTKLPNDFDYKMLAASNTIILSKFVIAVFMNNIYKTFISTFIAANGSQALYPYLSYICIDVILTAFDDKAFAYIIKILISLGLMISMVGNPIEIIPYPMVTFLLFVLPTSLVLKIGGTGKKLVAGLTMLTYYTTLLGLFVFVFDLNTQRQTVSYLGSLYKNASRFLQSISFL